MLILHEEMRGTNMVLYDFFCEECQKNFEELVAAGTANYECPICGHLSERTWTKTAPFLTVIVPKYPGSSGRTAGGCEEAHRPATKIMSGPAGCTSPKPKTIFAPE